MNIKTLNNKFSIFLLLIFFFFKRTLAYNFKQVVVTPGSFIINTVTTYQIYYDRTIDNFGNIYDPSLNPVPSGSTVTVTFPVQYTTINSSISCTVQVNTGSTNIQSCSPSGNLITITGLFSSNTIVYNLTLWVTNILNPSPAITTSSFTGTIGADVAVTNNGYSIVTFQPGQFPSCIMTFNPGYVNRTQNMIFTLTTKNEIASSGTIVVTFPITRRWTNDVSLSNYMPITSSMVCANQSSNVKSSVQCVGDIGTSTVTVSNVFNAQISAGGQFSFSINNFLSPPSAQASDAITITSFINGFQIDTCTDYVSGLLPNIIASNSITIQSTSQTTFTVNQNYTIKFAFTTVDTLSINDYFIIQFPASSTVIFSSGLLSGATAINKVNATFSNNILTLYMNTSSSTKIFYAPYSMFINVGVYTAPPSTQATSAFTITTMRNGFPTQTGTQTLSAIATTLSATVNATSSVVNVNTSYTFSITIGDSLTSSGKLKIIFPSSLKILISSSSCASISGVGLSSTPFCTFTAIDNSITLTSINSSSSNINAQTFNVTIQGIQNPPSTAPTSSFTISSFYMSTDDSLVATGIIGGITATFAQIDSSNVKIITSSDIVLATSVNYSITLTIQNPIPIGGFIIVNVPMPLVVDLSSISSSCQSGLNGSATQSTSCTGIVQSSSYKINFTSPFTSQSATALTNITLKLVNIVTNPPSTQPVSTFQIYTYSSNGYLIAQILGGLSVKVNTPTTLAIATYSRSSNSNNDITTYTFTVKQVPAFVANSIISVTFPASIIPYPNSTCNLVAPSAASLFCGLSSTTITLTLPNSAFASNTTITFDISNIRNPSSFAPPSAFTISTFPSNNVYQYASGQSTNVINNTIASSFLSVNGNYTPRYLNTNISLLVTFQPSNTAPGYIQISIPTYFNINSGGLTCNTLSDFNGSCLVLSSNSLQVNGNFTSSAPTTFGISGFSTPVTSPSTVSYILLSSYTSNHYKIDESTNQVPFTLACTVPCQTCPSASPTYCWTCYSSLSVTPKINYDNVTNSCYDVCPDGYYQDTVLNQCSPCDKNCLTCQYNSTYCLTCNQSSNFKYLNISITQKCVNSCLTTMYPDSTQSPVACVLCVSPCITCTALNYCYSCISTHFLYQNNCTAQCPVGTTVGNVVTQLCDPCNTSCLTCAGSINNCTSCPGIQILYLGGCINSCPSPLVYKPSISTCGPCDSLCKTCSGTESNCTSCDPASSYKYYLNNTCLVICPSLYYQDLANAKCQLCSSLALNCDLCQNSTYCTTCNAGYVFLNGTCLGTVPIGYVNISGTALPCTGDCATCSVTQANCTSCLTLNYLNNICQSTCPSGMVAISRICQNCTLPCLTCSVSRDNCTACSQTQTPQVYLINNVCQQVCPTYFYADNSSNQCKSCQIPCSQCVSLTNCTTCAATYFYYQSGCLPACLAGFIGLNSICQACLPPCKTCINATTICLTCVSTYFYLNYTNQCLLNCGNGLYADPLSKTCIYCTAPCKTCVNTTNTCLSCLTGILFGNICIDPCPDKMFNLSNTCTDCPATCDSCVSLSNCTSCISNYSLYNSNCISQCPPSYAVLVNGVCTKCTDTFCNKCYDSDICYNCVSGYSLLNGACLGTCPTGYETNGTNCLDIITQTMSSNSASTFPVPFTIAAAVILIACLMSKLQNDHTYLPGAIFSLIGLLQTLALALFIVLYYFSSTFNDQPLPLLICLIGFGVMYLLNILSMIQAIVLCYDKRFTIWRDSSALNKCFNGFVTIISFSLCHKFRNILFSRLFSFHVFSALLDDTKKFKIFNIFSFISLVHSGTAIFGASMALTKVTTSSQLKYACLDVIIVTSINVFMAFFNAMKPKQFFDQLTPQGLLLNKKVYGDQDVIQAKITPAGMDHQNQEGHGYYSKIQHNLASNQAFKFNQDESRQDLTSNDDSIGSLISKQYEEASVQAYQLIDEKTPSNKIDFSTLKPRTVNNDNSNFSTIFQHSDKSVQGNLNKMVDTSVQKSRYDQYNNQSIQNTIQNNQKVDYSVQKYSQIQRADRSMQKASIYNQDQSIQYSNRYQDQSVSMNNPSHHNVSIQHEPEYSQKQIQNQPSLHDKSGQYSVKNSDKGVQKMVMYQDISLQKSIQKEDHGDQRTLQIKEVSVQNEEDRVQYNQISDELQIQNSSHKNIFYMDQEQGLQLIPSPKKQSQKQVDKIVTSIPAQQQDEFNIPPQDLKSYQQELQQKIRAKEAQITRVKQQILLKQKHNELKLTKLKQDQERERIQKLRLEQEKQELQRQRDQKMVDEGTMKREVINSSPRGYQVDLNLELRQKQQPQSYEQSGPQSSKTKSKYHYPNSNKMQAKSQQKSTYLNQQKNIQIEQRKRKVIQVVDDTNKQIDEQNLQQIDDEQNQNNYQNYIYQVEDGSLNGEQISLGENNRGRYSEDQTKHNLVFDLKKDRHNLVSSGFDSSVTQIKVTNNKKLPQAKKEPQAILDMTQIDKNFDNDGFDQQLIDELDSSQDVSTGIINNPILGSGQNLKKRVPKSDMSDTLEQFYNSNANKLQTKTIGSKQNIQKQRKTREQNKQRMKSKQKQQNDLKNHINKQIRQSKDKSKSKYQNQTKKIPSEEKQQKINIPRFGSAYQVDKKKQQKRQASSRQKSSLLMAGKNTVQNTDNIIKKPSIPKNPLVSKKKWQFENEDKNISESGQESFVRGDKNNLRRQTHTSQNKRSHMVMPFQTDKQETQFRHAAIKVGETTNNNNRKKTNNQSLFTMQKQEQDEQQIQVHFMNDEIEQVQVQPKQKINQGNKNYNSSKLITDSFKNRSPTKPQLRSNANKLSTQFKKYESEQFFQDQSVKQDRNNIILNQMMERPQNDDDLMQYYHKTSRTGNNGPRRQSKEGNRKSLSKQKQKNDKMMSNIYLQRLDRKKDRY